MYPPDDRRIVNTMKAIAEQLANKANCGGIARYMDDYYFKVEPDTKKTPGNPWFMCTMWLAQWYIGTAKSAADLKPARGMIDSAGRHQLPSGPPSGTADPQPGSALAGVAVPSAPRRASLH